MNSNNNNPQRNIPKLLFLYRSIYIGKDDDYYLSYPLNILYWCIKIGKDVFKWIYSVSLIKKNISLFILLFLSPLLKFIFISLGSIDRFKKNFYRIKILLILIVILLLIESFFELPVHFLFPINKIYKHTNYYRIYDLRERLFHNVLIEIFENLLLFGYLIYYFNNGKFHYSAVIEIIFVILNIIFFIYSLFIYCFYDKFEIQKKRHQRHLDMEKNKYFYNKSNSTISNNNYNNTNKSVNNNDFSVTINNNNDKESHNYFLENNSEYKKYNTFIINQNNNDFNINNNINENFDKIRRKAMTLREQEEKIGNFIDVDSKSSFKNQSNYT